MIKFHRYPLCEAACPGAANRRAHSLWPNRTQAWRSRFLQILVYTENCSRTADDFFYHRGRAVTGQHRAVRFAARIVDKGQHDIFWLIDRKGRIEGVKVMIVVVTAVDNLVGGACLAHPH